MVAGVIGEMKFAYDVFGDTVNTASRMESAGKNGKINISKATFEMIDLATIPHGPGVYLHQDNLGKVIYVGKAKSLRKRVASYTKKQEHPRLILLCKKIVKTDYILTRNEIEALIL